MRRFRIVAVVAAIIYATYLCAAAEGAKAIPTASVVLVNGTSVAFDAYNINDNNYFKLRDIALVLDGTEAAFEVTYDADKNAIKLIPGGKYTQVGGELSQNSGVTLDATPTTSAVYFGDEELKLSAYNINGNNYFKLRDLNEAIGFFVGYDESTNTITIATSNKKKPADPANDFYLFMKYIFWGESTNTNKQIYERFTEDQLVLLHEYYWNIGMQTLSPDNKIAFYYIFSMMGYDDEYSVALGESFLDFMQNSFELSVLNISSEGDYAIIEATITKIADYDSSFGSINEQIEKDIEFFDSLSQEEQLKIRGDYLIRGMQNIEALPSGSEKSTITLEMKYLQEIGWVLTENYEELISFKY